MNKEKLPKLNTKPSLSRIVITPNPNLKKSTSDYGKLTVEALKRQKN